MSQQPAFDYIRHGQTPFFRLQTVTGSASGNPYQGHDAVVIGVPFDGGTTHHPGARFAPYEVRRVSALLQTYHPQHRIDVFRAISVIDGGNVPAPPFDAAMVRTLVDGMTSAIVSAGAAPFVVGGDHSIALPVMRAVARVHGPLAVVHVDAHLDTSGAEVWGDPFHHGTPLRHALTEGLIAPGQLHQIGIRASWGTPEDGALVAQHDARLYDMDVIEDRGIAAIAERIAIDVGDRPVYVTFDIDGVDPAYAPGTGTPEPGGLTAREALRLIRGLAGLDLVGMDVVEVCPARDVGDRTVTLAAHLLYEGLAVRAMRRE